MITAKDIWVIGDKLLKYDLALLSKARSMAGVCKGRVIAAMIYETDAKSCIRAGADEVYLLKGLEAAADDSAIAHALASLLREHHPGTVLFQATVRGRAIAPAVAALLKTGLTADCIDLEMEDSGLLLQKRPALGDSIIAEIVCQKHRPQIATVRQGVFKEPSVQEGRQGTVHEVLLPVTDAVTRTGFVPSQNSQHLTEAKIILAGGAGIGSRAGFDYMQEIALQIGGCVGASRSAVDAGFAPYSWQIGQTGIAVRPSLYIAVGISGAVQHLVGISASNYIVAINKDAKAPILQYADYAIIGDWRNALDQLQLCLRKKGRDKNEL